MKITINRRDLKNMTTGFSRIITGRQSLPILGCVRFCSGPGSVTSEVTDLDQTAVYDLGYSASDGEGDVIVPLDLLRRLSKGTDSETVILENDGDNIIVTNNIGGHAVTQSVPGFKSDDWPAAGGEIETAPAPGFTAAYRQLVPFASTDPTRMAICSVYVDVSGKAVDGTALVATDGRRLIMLAGITLPKLKTSVILPVSKFLLWSQLPEEAGIGVSADGFRFCVKAGPWTYRIKAYDGIYPNYIQVIPSAAAAEHRMRFTDDEVRALGKIIPAFPGEEYITFECCNDGRINLCGKDHEGVKDLCIPLTGGSTYMGAGCRVAVNRSSLLDALNAGFAEFAFADNCSPLLSLDGKGGTHVLMPLRPDGPVSRAKPAETAEKTQTQTETSTPAEQQVAAKSQLTEPAPVKEKHTMPKETDISTAEPTAFERLLVSFEVAKTKVKEAQSALADVTADIRSAAKEEKARRKEVESVRAGLQKLQSIQV